MCLPALLGDQRVSSNGGKRMISPLKRVTGALLAAHLAAVALPVAAAQDQPGAKPPPKPDPAAAARLKPPFNARTTRRLTDLARRVPDLRRTRGGVSQENVVAFVVPFRLSLAA